VVRLLISLTKNKLLAEKWFKTYGNDPNADRDELVYYKYQLTGYSFVKQFALDMIVEMPQFSGTLVAEGGLDSTVLDMESDDSDLLQRTCLPCRVPNTKEQNTFVENLSGKLKEVWDKSTPTTFCPYIISLAKESKKDDLEELIAGNEDKLLAYCPDETDYFLCYQTYQTFVDDCVQKNIGDVKWKELVESEGATKYKIYAKAMAADATVQKFFKRAILEGDKRECFYKSGEGKQITTINISEKGTTVNFLEQAREGKKQNTKVAARMSKLKKKSSIPLQSVHN